MAFSIVGAGFRSMMPTRSSASAVRNFAAIPSAHQRHWHARNVYGFDLGLTWGVIVKATTWEGKATTTWHAKATARGSKAGSINNTTGIYTWCGAGTGLRESR